MQNQQTSEWKTARTAIYVLITTQLQHCQQQATTGLFCDLPSLGKTHAGKEYAAHVAGSHYIDCSQVKTKHLFIRALAAAFGLQPYGRLYDVRNALIAAIKKCDHPLIILDEAGDLDYPAFLEIKALYNATEHHCGWYMMGAQGLEAKIERMRANCKVGYEELYDRFGARYQSLTADMETAEQKAMLRHAATEVLRVNMPGLTKQQAEEILKSSALNLRRLRKEVVKAKNPQLFN